MCTCSLSFSSRDSTRPFDSDAKNRPVPETNRGETRESETRRMHRVHTRSRPVLVCLGECVQPASPRASRRESRARTSRRKGTVYTLGVSFGQRISATMKLDLETAAAVCLCAVSYYNYLRIYIINNKKKITKPSSSRVAVQNVFGTVDSTKNNYDYYDLCTITYFFKKEYFFIVNIHTSWYNGRLRPRR